MISHRSEKPLAISVLLTAVCVSMPGCGDPSLARMYYDPAPQVAPLGAISDATWSGQEDRAEASKFVFYDHEFKLRSNRLNMAGEDHVKQVAARIHAGTTFPVVIERSMNDKSQGTYNYPVNPNPELDNQRREIIVASLRALGVEHADQVVVVAPAFSTAATAQEAESAYLRGISSARSNGTFGGGFGGFAGGGGLVGGITASDDSGLGGIGGFVGGGMTEPPADSGDDAAGP